MSCRKKAQKAQNNSFCSFCAFLRLTDRQADLEAGVAGFGFETNVAAVFADDAGDGVETQAGAFADRFGGEEWFKDPRPHFRRYARTVITNFDHDVGWFTLRTYLELSA